MKILIIDDHFAIHQGLQRVLVDEFPRSSFGEARTYKEAIQLLPEQVWDLVILDIDLPDRGGFDLLQQIREQYPKLAVLIFSMHAEDHFAIRALKLGASGYIAKDAPSEQLLDAVRKTALGRKYVSPSLAERLASDLNRELPLGPHELLSNREFEVMRMIAAGQAPTSIADTLCLSIKTVSTCRARILDKLHLETNADLIRYAIAMGLDRS